jgi:hypothetical protein
MRSTLDNEAAEDTGIGGRFKPGAVIQRVLSWTSQSGGLYSRGSSQQTPAMPERDSP